VIVRPQHHQRRYAGDRWLLEVVGWAWRVKLSLHLSVDLMRDSRGFRWVCTRDGLSRFDGSHFVTYQVGDKSAPPGIEQILETFTVVLNNPTGATLGLFSTTTVAITDDSPESLKDPIDDPQAFVHTHYHDFLNREPDPAGLAFWTGQITSCGSDVQCIEDKRINVSAAFYLSIEFQQTGYLLYLMQKESYANLPHYSPFMRDLQEISRGVIVNSLGWQQKLADNQTKFAGEWINRPAFKASYDGLSNNTYVNVLYANAGIVPPQVEKDTLVTALDSAKMDRAAVLLEVAANATFRQQEQNSAFVLMQYFGYLRRDPNAAPDSDLSGYSFWLNKLNQFGGNYVNAEMIKAFITSIEYKQRFAQ